MARKKAHDAGDETEVQSRADRLKTLRMIEMTELRDILSTRGGRYFIWRLLCEAGVYRDDRGLDTGRLHERAGERGVGNWVLAECFEADPEFYNILRAEGAVRDAQKEKSK